MRVTMPAATIPRISYIMHTYMTYMHIFKYIYICVCARIEATHLCLALGALLGATGARSVAATCKPPMLVPQAQLPARAR